MDVAHDGKILSSIDGASREADDRKVAGVRRDLLDAQRVVTKNGTVYLAHSGTDLSDLIVVWPK